MVVIGGSALLALGLVSRATRDVDVVGLRSSTGIDPARPMPAQLEEAATRVARDIGLPSDWLNAGPTELLDLGMPEGFEERLHREDVGPALTLFYADRYDQIHFKLYAMVDQAGGRHEADLRALEPTPRELIAAARWTRSHDPSPGFREQLLLALHVLGVSDADVD